MMYPIRFLEGGGVLKTKLLTILEFGVYSIRGEHYVNNR